MVQCSVPAVRKGLRALSVGSGLGFQVALALAPTGTEKYSVSFTERRKRLSVASELPQSHSQQQEGPGQGF